MNLNTYTNMKEMNTYTPCKTVKPAARLTQQQQQLFVFFLLAQRCGLFSGSVSLAQKVTVTLATRCCSNSHSEVFGQRA